MMKGEHEVLDSYIEQVDKLEKELNRYRTALQDIREYKECMDANETFAVTMIEIAVEALEGE